MGRHGEHERVAVARYVDVFYSHRFDERTPLDETQRLDFDPEELAAIDRFARPRGR